ncbi:hypothetical protein F5144DRAFT_296976 [Chaetomium tenue]|uniref:Uncharacterized protein n=1 Tax=Chaetomium tenue TaxID=1854479 RepID=A0ACB7P2N4_9PEZI|nr:hypothetical protein F5144DRAFT_296976 [Chaetomium globosum]
MSTESGRKGSCNRCGHPMGKHAKKRDSKCQKCKKTFDICQVGFHGSVSGGQPVDTAVGWRICWVPCSCGEQYYPDKARAARPLASHEYKPEHPGFRPRSPENDAADTTEYDTTAYSNTTTYDTTAYHTTSFPTPAATVSAPAYDGVAHAADYASASLAAGYFSPAYTSTAPPYAVPVSPTATYTTAPYTPYPTASHSTEPYTAASYIPASYMEDGTVHGHGVATDSAPTPAHAASSSTVAYQWHIPQLSDASADPLTTLDSNPATTSTGAGQAQVRHT